MSNELDKHIGERLGRYESDVDTEALWQAVKPPRRRRPWLLLLLLGISIGVGVAWWTLVQEDNESLVEGRSQIDAGPAEQKRALEDEMLAAADSKDKQRLAPARGDDKGSVLNKDLTHPAAPAKNSAITAISNDEGLRSGFPSSNVDLLPKNRVANRLVESDLPSSTEKLAPELSLLAPLTPKERNTEIIHPAREIGEDFALGTPRGKGIAAIEKLNFAVKRGEKTLPISTIVGDIPTYQRGRRSSYFVQFDGAYLQLQRSLANRDSLAITTSWAERRRNTEQLLEGISADLSFGYRSHNGWQLRGGLGYTQLNTMFERTITTQIVDTLIGLQTLIYHPDNSVDSILGPVAFYETLRREKQTYNSIRQWELPLLAGYHFDLGTLSLLVEAGVRLQLNRSWEGEVSRVGETEEFLDLATTEWYRNEFGVNLQGGIQLVYPLSKQVDILGGATVRYSLKDYSQETSPFKERYQLLGGQLSLRYKF